MLAIAAFNPVCWNENIKIIISQPSIRAAAKLPSNLAALAHVRGRSFNLRSGSCPDVSAMRWETVQTASCPHVALLGGHASSELPLQPGGVCARGWSSACGPPGGRGCLFLGHLQQTVFSKEHGDDAPSVRPEGAALASRIRFRFSAVDRHGRRGVAGVSANDEINRFVTYAVQFPSPLWTERVTMAHILKSLLITSPLS